MKKTTFLAFLTLLLFNGVTAQVLLNDNFDNYTLGNIGTDPNGVIPGQGGWFTKGGIVTDYSIASESGKGNVLRFESLTATSAHREVFKTDLFTQWQKRTTSNNILKFAVDFYTDDYDGIHLSTNTDIAFFDVKGQILFGYEYYLNERYINVFVNDKQSATKSYKLLTSNGQQLLLPKNTWLTLELYIDYDYNKVYYSIPALNYTIVFNTNLAPLGGTSIESVPEKLLFRNSKNGIGNYTLKFDNINLSAQNTTPIVTVGLKEFLSLKFNLFPNPATNLVNITNSENMSVKQIEIYDLAGKLINIQNFNNQKDIQLGVQSLAIGTYMLHIQSDLGTAVKKLIKK